MELPFYGQVRITENGETVVRYILVGGKNDVAMYTKPPPFEIMTFVGRYGTMWKIRRIKRGWLLSTFIITFTEEEKEFSFQCQSDSKFGDLLVNYTAQ